MLAGKSATSISVSWHRVFGDLDPCLKRFVAVCKPDYFATDLLKKRCIYINMYLTEKTNMYE